MPLFFILSGYFLGGKIVQEPSKAISIASKYTKKLAVVFLFWCVVYAIEQPLNFLSLVKEDPIRLLFEGTRTHLWYLVSLILTVWLFTLWPFDKESNHFLLLGGALYVFGLLGGSYKATPFGFDFHFDTRNGVFFGALFFAIGVAFHKRMPRVSWMTAICIALMGLGIFCLEAYYLRQQCSISPIQHDYLLGTVPLGVGVSLLAFTQRDSSIDRFVGPYGRYVLGIYVSHLLFVDLLRPLGLFVQPIAWQFIFPILVLGLSLLSSIILSRTPLRRVVV
jgi:surface polysaccharide O-acyltransferase-like enzyme